MKNRTAIRQTARTVSAILFVLMLTGFSGTASAAILFQDDTFTDVLSDIVRIGSNDAGGSDTGIRFGADAVPGENGNINWDIATNTFEFDNTVAITGGLSATGNANFSGASQFHVREVANEALATCTTIDEVVLDTAENRFYVCTVVGAPGTWVGADAGSADDFEDVYATDADDTLTTGGGSFSISAGGGEFDVTSAGGLIDFNAATFDADLTGAITLDAGAASNLTTSAGDMTLSATAGSTNVLGGEAAVDAVRINASNAAGGIDVDAGTGGIDVDTTGAFSITGAANSTVETTGAFDLALSAGDDMFFDDAQLLAAIQLTSTATGFAATYAGGGIIDNLNELTLTTASNGASDVGLEAGSLANVVPASNDVQAALEALDAAVGAGADNNDALTFFPEFEDVVIFRDGSSNEGTLSAEYDNVNNEHYYDWISLQAGLQDIDLRFRFVLPPDFAATGDFTGRYRTGLAPSANNNIDYTVSNGTNLTGGLPTTCGTSLANSGVAWATATITAATINTGCAGATALDAGDIVQVIMKLYSNSTASAFAEVGRINLDYTN